MISSTVFVFVWLVFVPIETDDANKAEEKQASEAGESEEKRDKTKEELEKESTEAKEDEKKTSSKSKELEPTPSKTKGPTVSGYVCLKSKFSLRMVSFLLLCIRFAGASRDGLRNCDFLRMVPTNSKSVYARLTIACERRRISGCRFSPPEIRLRSQARLTMTSGEKKILARDIELGVTTHFSQKIKLHFGYYYFVF